MRRPNCARPRAVDQGRYHLNSASRAWPSSVIQPAIGKFAAAAGHLVGYNSSRRLKQLIGISVLLAASSPLLSETVRDPLPDIANRQGELARSIVSAEHPDLDWPLRATHTSDVDGDGSLDFLLVGIANERFVVAVARSLPEKLDISYLDFAISNAKQKAACGTPVGWGSFKRSDAPLVALGGYPAGYQDCSTCLEYILYDSSECDMIRVYWNHSNDRLDWWRP